MAKLGVCEANEWTLCSVGDVETLQFSQDLCRSAGVTIRVGAGMTTSAVSHAATETALESIMTGASVGNRTRDGGQDATRTGVEGAMATATNDAARMLTHVTEFMVVVGVILSLIFVV